MNFFQGFNNTMALGTLAALATGLFRNNKTIHDHSTATWLFASFLFLQRLKVYFDDHQYFQRASTREIHFKIGIFVGAVSWLLWILAAHSIQLIGDAYFLAGWAIGISTIWIIIVALKRGAYRQQYIWLGTNALFVLILWAVSKRIAMVKDGPTVVLLCVAIALVIVDIVVSRSVPELASEVLTQKEAPAQKLRKSRRRH